MWPCLYRDSTWATSDCCIMSSGVVGPYCFIINCFPFLFLILRAFFFCYIITGYICMHVILSMIFISGYFDVFVKGAIHSIKNHSTLPLNRVQTSVWATWILRLKEGRTLLSVISAEGASCKKRHGLPTAISLNSSTKPLAQGWLLYFFGASQHPAPLLTSSTSFHPESFYRSLFVLLW